MQQDIMLPRRSLGHSRQFRGAKPSRSLVVVRHTTVRPAAVLEPLEVIIVEPTPMVRAVESLTPVEKVRALEGALLRARYELKAEGRKWRHLKLRHFI